MKKERNSSRKLTLNRETVRHLQEAELQKAVGGETLQLSCDTITWRRCATDAPTCE